MSTPRKQKITPLSAIVGELVLGASIQHASPFVLAASLIPDSRLFITQVQVTSVDELGMFGLIDQMGGHAQILSRERSADGAVLDVEVRHHELHPIDFSQIPLMTPTDHILLILLAQSLRGESVIEWPNRKGYPDLGDVRRILRQIGIASHLDGNNLVISGNGTRATGGTITDEPDGSSVELDLLLLMAGSLSRRGITTPRLTEIDAWWPGLADSIGALTVG